MGGYIEAASATKNLDPGESYLRQPGTGGWGWGTATALTEAVFHIAQS